LEFGMKVNVMFGGLHPPVKRGVAGRGKATVKLLAGMRS
jgi:hypothetical protein